jgi:transcriptional regulator with XRE-family HTH domain
MDRRRNPITPHEQLKLRQELYAMVDAHPEWEFAQVMHQVRRSLHLTLAEMAKVGRVSVPALKRIESGTGNPTLKTMARLLHPFGLRVATIRTATQGLPDDSTETATLNPKSP